MYLLQLLRSGNVRSAAPTWDNLRTLVLMSCGLRMTIDAVFWSLFAKSSLQSTPIVPSSYSDALSIMVWSAKSQKMTQESPFNRACM